VKAVPLARSFGARVASVSSSAESHADATPRGRWVDGVHPRHGPAHRVDVAVYVRRLGHDERQRQMVGAAGRGAPADCRRRAGPGRPVPDRRRGGYRTRRVRHSRGR
jgi:hypothetical protein